MRVLVTGADGFLGRHVLPLLVEAGHEVLAVGRRPAVQTRPWPTAALDLSAPGAGEDARILQARFRARVLVHLAGFTSVGASWSRPDEALEVNATGTARLLKGLDDHPPELIIGMGSAEEYAPQGYGKLQEMDFLQPRNPYGVSKLAQELLMDGWARTRGVKHVHFRAFNQTGPGQDSRFVVPRLVQELVQRARGNRSTPLRVGNLASVRDFLDVRDAARILASTVQGRVAPGVYNLCSGTGRTVRSILVDIAALLAFEPRLVPDPALLRPDDPPRLVGDNARLAGQLPVVTIPWLTTLREMVQAAGAQGPAPV